MLKTKPHMRIFTRPSRSARPPMTTMKMPENRAVIETAMFMTFVATLRAAAIPRRNVQGGLREQPECEDTENDPAEEFVIASVIGRWSDHEPIPSSAPGLALGGKQAMTTRTLSRTHVRRTSPGIR